MKADANKNITAIQYNYLNLPTQVSINGQDILYVYDAVGTKLSKTVNSITTDYAGNFIYENGVLQFFNTAEGYVEPDGSGGYNYVYQYKDHLGDIRLSYKDISSTSTPSLQIVEENNYYPFGLKHKGYNTIINGTHHKYMFGGKEFDESFQTLNTYDFGARNYDPALGRWMNIDKLAEDPTQIDLSPYAYVGNDPISKNDPDGNCPSCIWGAVIGAAVEYGGQVIANRLEDKSWSESFSDIDVGDVLVSAGEGALTGGVSAIRSVAAKTAITIGAEVITNTLDAKVKGGKLNIKVNDAKTVARNTVIGLAVNGAGKGIPSTKVKVKSEITPKQAVKTARTNGVVNRTQRKEIQTQAKKNLKDNKAINKTVNGSPRAIVSGGTTETIKRKESKANEN